MRALHPVLTMADATASPVFRTRAFREAAELRVTSALTSARAGLTTKKPAMARAMKSTVTLTTETMSNFEASSRALQQYYGISVCRPPLPHEMAINYCWDLARSG